MPIIEILALNDAEINASWIIILCKKVPNTDNNSAKNCKSKQTNNQHDFNRYIIRLFECVNSVLLYILCYSRQFTLFFIFMAALFLTIRLLWSFFIIFLIRPFFGIIFHRLICFKIVMLPRNFQSKVLWIFSYISLYFLCLSL